jgi:nicotinamidase-related amidase
MSPLPGPLDPRRTALLVVDVQNDFCSPDGFFARNGLDVSPGAAVVRRIVGLVDGARRSGLQVVYTKSVRAEPARQRLAPSRPFYAGGTPLASGTWGSELVDGLAPAAGEVVLEKPRYSAFHRTGLDGDLRARAVETVALAGVTTNCCIDSTMRDAYMLDFDVVVLADCVAGFGGEEALHDATLRNAELLFGVVATSEQLLAALEAPAVAPA